MTNMQSPPRLLNVYEVLNEIGINKLQQEIELFGKSIENTRNVWSVIPEDHYAMKYIFYDSNNLKKFEEKLKKNRFFPNITILLIEVRIDIQGHCLLMKINKRKGISFDFKLSSLPVFKAMHHLRYLISLGYLDAYIQYNCIYHKVDAALWHTDYNWYRLLADGRMHHVKPPIAEIIESIYFRKEDVERCMSFELNEKTTRSFKFKAPLINSPSFLFNPNEYITPWLQVLNAVYEQYGKEKLAEAAKTSVEVFIEEYIEKHQLDIAASDIPYLAKFIRLAEQKEGKKYHAKRKKSSEQNNI